MDNYSLPYWGEININALEEYYDIETKLNGNTIRIDLNFDQSSIDKDRMNLVKDFIERIHDFDKRNKVYINNDYTEDNGDTVKAYVAFHIEELGDDFLHQINLDSKQANIEQEFIARLRLVRVGLYPDGKYDTKNFAVFDYTVGREVTDQLLVVNTDANGNLDYLSWES